MIKRAIKKLLSIAGYEVYRATASSHLSQDLIRRKRILEYFSIDTLLDVGANTGEYAEHMRKALGFNGSIISFEPLSSAFEVLEKTAQNDPDWKVFNFGLGDDDRSKEINIASNSYSSSLLEMLPAHLESAPQSRYVGKEVVEIKRLDSIFTDLSCAPANIYLKLDTQGYESKVLSGASRSLELIDTIQMELSLVPLYENEILFLEMCHFMADKGYTLISVEPGFSDPDSEQLLQIDGIFRRF